MSVHVQDFCVSVHVQDFCVSVHVQDFCVSVHVQDFCVSVEQRRQFSSGGSFHPLFIIAGFLNILSKVSGKCARARMQLAARYVKMKSW